MKTNLKKQNLHSTYQRIKKNCCEEWQKEDCFLKWHAEQLEKQEQLCWYCHLPGDTIHYYQRHFTKGHGRGFFLEVERKDSTKPYCGGNCVLACYPCNNAKSDVFTYEEFLKIGKAIHEAKTWNIPPWSQPNND